MGMCIHCKVCGHFYGAWRPRCEACGTPTPSDAIAKLEDAARLKNATPRELRRHARKQHDPRDSASATLCVFCKLRGARKRKCKYCGGKLHPSCRTLHETVCEMRDPETAAPGAAEIAMMIVLLLMFSPPASAEIKWQGPKLTPQQAATTLDKSPALSNVKNLPPEPVAREEGGSYGRPGALSWLDFPPERPARRLDGSLVDYSSPAVYGGHVWRTEWRMHVPPVTGTRRR